mgnify:CR=1 FL=1
MVEWFELLAMQKGIRQRDQAMVDSPDILFVTAAGNEDNDVEFDVDRFVVKGAPEKFKTMKEIAEAILLAEELGAGTKA